MEGTPKNQTTGPARNDLISRPSQSGTMLDLPRLILASASPRRAEILRIVGWPFDTHILEKPRETDDARRMLRLLSDRWHRVLTGIAIIHGALPEIKVAYETTEVKFAAMRAEEIDWYV